MHRSNSIFTFLCLVSMCLLFSCAKESDIFLGEWQDSRTPENVWEINRKGSVFTGKRISGDDFYKYDSEEWTFQIGRTGAPTLVPVDEKGSTLMFQARENRILRNPPGRTYVKIIKDK